MLPQPDRPERIAVNPAGDAAAFVIGPGREGPGEATGLWHGPLGGRPAKLDGTVPDTNLAFEPDGGRLALAVPGAAGSEVIVADPAAPPDSWPRFPLPAFAEQIAWTGAGLIVLAADPGADAASLTSGKPLPGAEQDPVVAAGEVGFRRLWLVDPGSGDAGPVSPEDLAIWEFAPVPGGGAIVVASDDPTEAGWYHSRLEQLDATGARQRVLLESAWQLSCPAVSGDGLMAACVEGWASDRGLLAGEVRLLRLDQGAPEAVPLAALGDPAGAEFADIEAGVAHCAAADQPARYLDRSPVTRLSAASSPALILHGQQDRCVPVSQAEELYAGLREFGIPAEFVCYPREGHQATEPAHVADQRARILRWLGTYLEVAS